MEQTLQDIEFIFVDDCSPDRSVEILKEITSKYPLRNIKLLRQPINQGVSNARELALSKATGKYIGFCDSDDWVDNNMYEELVKVAEQNEADIVGCGFIEHSGEGLTETKFLKSIDDNQLIFSYRCFGGVYGALWNKIIRREFFEKESKDLWKNIIMWEDSCLLIPLRLRSTCTIFIDQCLYHYNVNANSITTIFSERKVADAIEATRRLENFFNTEKMKKDAEPLIHYLKVASKEILLRYPEVKTIKMWKQTFPEAKHYIWVYPNWNFVLKIRTLLVAYLPISVGVQLLKIKRRKS